MNIRLSLLSLALSLGTLVLQGCAGPMPVQPWEKGNLARPEMQFDVDRLDAAFVEHTYASKEGTFGNTVVGGGGCGCN